MKPSPRHILISSLSIAWITLALLLFVLYSARTSYIHGSSLQDWPLFTLKLTQLNPFLYIKDLVFAGAGVVVLAAACTGLGAFILRYFYDETADSRIQWVALLTSAFLLGEITFSIIFLALGMAGQLTPGLTVSALTLGILSGAISFRHLVRSYPGLTTGTGGLGQRRSKNETAVLWLCLMVITSALLFASARLSYDSVALYFSNAKLTALQQRTQFFISDPFIVSWFHTGILYTVLIQIFGDQAARLISWINGAGILIMVLALADRAGLTQRGKIISLALLMTSTAFVDLLGDGKVELASTLPALAAIFWLLAGGRAACARGYLLAGIFLGFAMISRPYTAVLLGGFVALDFLTNRSQQLSPRLKSLGLMAVPVILLLCFHVFANLAILGDPLAPVNNTLKLNANTWQWSSVEQDDLWLFRLLYPLVVTFLNTPQSLGNISPLIVTCLPLLFTGQVRSRMFLPHDLKRMTVIAGTVLIFWVLVYFTVLEIRYVLFLWVLIYLAAAQLISIGIEVLTPSARQIAESIIIFLLLFIVSRNLFIAVEAYTPIDENNTPQCGGFIFCDYLTPVNRLAQPGERVLTLNAYRYYLRPDLFACSTQNQEYDEIRRAALISAESFWEEVYEQGYTFITYERNYTERHLYMDFLPGPENAPEWVQLETLREAGEGFFVSYQIHFSKRPQAAVKTCSQDHAIWSVQAPGTVESAQP